MKYNLLVLTVALSTSAIGQPIWTATELGHQDWINVVAFSPDGTLLASGSDDQSILLRNTETGQELRRFAGHTGPVLSIDFSPNGTQLISGSEDESIRLWNVTTGQELQRFVGHTGPVYSVDFSPNGTQLISGSEDESIRLWNVTTGQELQHFAGHTGPVYSVDFSPDGTQLISGSEDASIRLWDVSSAEELRNLSVHMAPVNSVVFSPNSDFIFSGSDDNSARLSRVANGELIRSVDHKEEVVSVKFSPDGTQMVSGSSNNEIILVDLLRGRRTTLTLFIPPSTPTGNLSSLAFSPDGSHVAWGVGQVNSSGGLYGHTSLWNIASRDHSDSPDIRSFTAHTYLIYSLAFSPDGSQLASASWDGTVRLWDPTSGRALQTIASMHTIYSLAYSPDGTQLAIGTSNGDVILSDVVTGKELMRFAGLENVRESALAFSPDGSQLASSSRGDGSILLWNTSTGEELLRISGHTAPVNSMVFSPNGTRLISGSDDRSIRLWDTGTGQELQIFSGHLGAVHSIAISPDGNQLASASSDATVRLWETGGTGQDHRVFTGHSAAVLSVDFFANGTRLVSGSLDGRIIRWDISIGQEIDSRNHGTSVWSVAVSPNGKFLASAGRQTLNLWDWEVTSTPEPLTFSQSIADQSFPRGQSITPLILPTAVGGTMPIYYTLTPALPAGLDFNASRQIISGTPTTVTGSPVEYTYTATDAVGATQSLLFKINVYSPVSTEVGQSLPEEFTIVGNYPNPVQDVTQLTFDLPWPARMRVEVTDVTGRRVLTIPEKILAAGRAQTISLDGGSLPAGLYLYRLIANSSSGNSVRVGNFVRAH